jgi:hypothetical protein
MEPRFTPESAIAYLKEMMEHYFKSGAINGWCGICQSRDLHYEDGVTKFTSINEAVPEIAACQIRQKMSRDAIDRMTAYQRN